MPTREDLMSHNIAYLRNEVRKTNIEGFSTMKKDKLVDRMMAPSHRHHFHHIVHSGRKGRVSYQGKKQVRVSKAKDREAMKKTKAGRLALIQEKIDALPANASAGRIEALRAKLREEKKKK